MIKGLIKISAILLISIICFSTNTNWQQVIAGPIVNDCTRVLIRTSKFLPKSQDPFSGQYGEEQGDPLETTDTPYVVCNATTLSVDGPIKPPKGGGGGGSSPTITRSSYDTPVTLSFKLADLWKNSCNIPGLSDSDRQKCQVLADFAMGDLNEVWSFGDRGSEHSAFWFQGSLLDLMNHIVGQIGSGSSNMDRIAEYFAIAIGCPTCAETIKNSAIPKLIVEVLKNAAIGFTTLPNGSTEIMFSAVGTPTINPEILTHSDLRRNDLFIVIGHTVKMALSQDSLSTLYKLIIGNIGTGTSPYQLLKIMFEKGYISANGIVTIELKSISDLTPPLRKHCYWYMGTARDGKTGVGLTIRCV